MLKNTYPSVVAPATSSPQFTPAAPGQGPQNTGTPLASRPGANSSKSRGSLIQTILLIVLGLVALVFIALYISKYIEWRNIRNDIDAEIDAAVALAVAENTTKMESEFAEREKYPYRTFMGPADYGSLSFEYPQTWSVYISSDAADGGDFAAYLNPTEVEPVSTTTINALRVRIRDAAFDNVVKEFDSYVRDGRLQFSNTEVGGVIANVYVGTLPNNIVGKLVVFKLRDKTVMLQTDADIFITEFDKLLSTVTMIQ